MTAENVIDLQALLEKAKPLRINLVEREWLEIQGGDGRQFPASNEGRVQIDEILIAKGFTKEHERPHMIQYKQQGRPMYDIVSELNDKMKQLGIEPQEGHFSYWEHDWRPAEEERTMRMANMTTRPFSLDEHQAQHNRDHIRPLPLDYRWCAVYPVTGGSEGYYIHVDFIWQKEAHKMPCMPALRKLIDRIERLPYDEQTYKSDKQMVEEANTAIYGQPTEYRKMLALAKTWEWDNACACSAVAAMLLQA